MSYCMKSLVTMAVVVTLASAFTALKSREDVVSYESNNPDSYRCVNIRNISPCRDLPDGQFDICNECRLGYFAQCKDGNIVTLPCGQSKDDNGNHMRLVFDSVAGKCMAESTTCRAYSDAI